MVLLFEHCPVSPWTSPPLDGGWGGEVANVVRVPSPTPTLPAREEVHGTPRTPDEIIIFIQVPEISMHPKLRLPARLGLRGLCRRISIINFGLTCS